MSTRRCLQEHLQLISDCSGAALGYLSDMNATVQLLVGLAGVLRAGHSVELHDASQP